MSNALAVAATTQTLTNLMAQASPNVTALPPDKAHDEGTEDQLNLFLFSVALAAAWRNSDPLGTPPGETGPAPLPLVLRYLVTAYAADEAKAHILLGRAMSVLHDHSILGGAEIRDATSGTLPDSDLHLQPERVRVTPLQLSTHDMFELWSGFATSYRVSQAYEVSVILIDSTRGRTAPLPVLRQGPGPDSPRAVPGPAADLTALLPPSGAAVPTLGDGLRVLGTNLGSVTGLRFANRRLAGTFVLPPDAGGSDTERAVQLPESVSGLDTWVAGVYDVALVTALPGQPLWTSSTRSFGLGPLVEVAPLAAPAGDVALTITCRPRIRTGQDVLVVLGSQQPQAPDSVTTPADATQPTKVQVTFRAVPAGTHVVRLRVDGVDSDPVRLAGSPPRPEFDPAAQVVVT
jgi:Pvc16 N-terminal domain